MPENFDWNIVLVAFFATIAPTILAIATLVQQIRTHKATNSKMDQFLKLTGESAFAAGQKAEAKRKGDS